MGNWIGCFFEKTPPPPMVLVPPMFDFPPLDARTRMLEPAYDLLFGKLVRRCLFEDYFEQPRHFSTRVMLKPIDDPHVDLIATVAGPLDSETGETLVGNALFRWQRDLEDPHTFMDLFVSNSEQILNLRSCAYYPKYGIGAFGIFPLLKKKRILSDDYGVMGLRYGSEHLSVGVTLLPFPCMFLYGDQARFFSDEIHPDLTHSKIGTVAMASAGENLNASQFYFTLQDNLDYLDGKRTVFGEVAEGMDALTRINEAYVDEKGRPYKNIRIKHTYILDDPFEDPPQLAELIPERSPEGKPPDEIIDVRLEDDWVPMDETLGSAELEEALRTKEAESNAVFLETVGDIPDAEIKPPENVLFVCKLNPVTQDEDLDTIFSRFGTVLSSEVIRDYKTGDSLCYAFIEFEDKEACERAYFKMDNALIDDRRIHVDFSQSVAKLWSQYRRGKGNQSGKGRGCFKCGALDHIAKDCAEGLNTNKQTPKYILKDDNAQRGGNGHQRYEMLFEGDTSPSMDHERSHRRDYEHNERKYSGEWHKSEEIQDRDSSHRQRQDKQDQTKRSDNNYVDPPASEDQERKRRKDDNVTIHAKAERDDDRRSRDRVREHNNRHKRRDIDIDDDHGNRHKRRDVDRDGERWRSEQTDRSPFNYHKKREIDRSSNSSYRGRDGRDNRKRTGDYHSKSDRKDVKERR